MRIIPRHHAAPFRSRVPVQARQPAAVAELSADARDAIHEERRHHYVRHAIELGVFGSITAGVISAVPGALVPTAVAGAIGVAALAIRHKIHQFHQRHPQHPRHRLLRHVRHALAVTAALAIGSGVLMAVPYNNFPPPMSAAAQFLDQHVAGESVLPAPALPKLPTLNPSLVAAAKKRGAGQTITVGAIRDTKGGYHEPPLVIVYGPEAKLRKILLKEGWGNPTLVPISLEYLDGKRPAFAFQKNAQLGGLSRDHLRDYHEGHDEDEIAASQDVAPEIEDTKKGDLSFHHRVSHDLSGERNLVAHDILAGDPAARATVKMVKIHRQVNNTKSYPSDGYAIVITLS